MLKYMYMYHESSKIESVRLMCKQGCTHCAIIDDKGCVTQYLVYYMYYTPWEYTPVLTPTPGWVKIRH